jgi:hypothetical protein
MFSMIFKLWLSCFSASLASESGRAARLVTGTSAKNGRFNSGQKCRGTAPLETRSEGLFPVVHVHAGPGFTTLGSPPAQLAISTWHISSFELSRQDRLGDNGGSQGPTLERALPLGLTLQRLPSWLGLRDLGHQPQSPRAAGVVHRLLTL